MTAPRTPEEFDWYQHPSQYPHLNPVRQMLTAAGWEERSRTVVLLRSSTVDLLRRILAVADPYPSDEAVSS